MEASIYIAISSQLALERRLNTVADNVANANTAGFRASEVKFREEVSRAENTSVAYVSEGQEYLNTNNGGLTHTQNPFDFAVRGNAWFAIDTPAGQTLTRDGRFSITANGELISSQGYPVLDSGGSPIQLDGSRGVPVASADGVLYQEGNPVASLGIFEADVSQGFIRVGNSGIVPTSGAQPVVDRIDAGVVQGYIEESNVNPVVQMTKLISLQRNYENIAGLIRENETSLTDAIKTLGENR